MAPVRSIELDPTEADASRMPCGRLCPPWTAVGRAAKRRGAGLELNPGFATRRIAPRVPATIPSISRAASAYTKACGWQKSAGGMKRV